MALFKRNNPKNKVEEQRSSSTSPLGLLFNSVSSFSDQKALSLSAFFCGVEQISNAVAMLPFNVAENKNDELKRVKHNLNFILGVQPNNRWNPFNMWKEAVQHIILRGNAYFYIERDERLNVKAIYPIENDFVTVLPQEDGTVKYSVSGFRVLEAFEMIDIAMHRDEFYNGVPLLKYAYRTLNGASNAETASDNFYKSGAGLSGILKASATLTDAQKQQIRTSWDEAFSGEKARGIAVLPQGLDFQAVSVSPEDAQMLESRQFNVLEIARFLNISPIRLFDLSDVSYSSMEATNLSFLSDTVAPYMSAILSEMDLKLFKPSEVGKFEVITDYKQAMQTNRQALAEYYRTLLNSGVLCIDEVRSDLGYPKLGTDAGKMHYIQVSYANAEDIAQGKFIKNGGQDQNQELDKKLG